ncbi:MAG: thermonuclease family protein [Candidatus Limnocylindrales bacterium]
MSPKSIAAVLIFAAAIAACQPPGASVLPTRLAPTPVAPSVLSSGLAPIGAVEEATVTYVSDGDTVRVAIDGGRDELLRYIGVDAPEIDGPYANLEPWGPEAADANRALVEDETVYLEKDVSNVDPNGRLLRYVWLKDGTGWLMVNRELVRLGLARARDYRPDTKFSDVLFEAQDEARDGDRGIWSDD